jgi:secreted trypsin-like serine protease
MMIDFDSGMFCGSRSASSSGNESVDADFFLGATVPVASLTNATFVMTYLNIVSCPSKQAVTLTCQHMECGVRSVPPETVGPYIVNGDVAARGAWPWQIQLYIGGQFECGGSIINERWILTAAHCVTGSSASEFIVKLGSTTLDGEDCQTFSVTQVFQNPLYGNLGHDNALLHLASAIQFSDTASPICMPSPSIDLRQFRVCVATGFGRRRYGSEYPVSPILLQAKMHLMSYDACVANALNVTGPNGNSYVTDDIDYRVMICAGSSPSENDINICNGDSGGPLACQDQHGIWTQIGVVSWGFFDTRGIACQNSVFARLPALMDWVQNTIAANSNF